MFPTSFFIVTVPVIIFAFKLNKIFITTPIIITLEPSFSLLTLTFKLLLLTLLYSDGFSYLGCMFIDA